MIHIRCIVSCDGCEKYFSEDHFGSVAEAGLEAEKQGWKTVGIYNRWFHFCPECQKPEMEVKTATAGQ